MRCAYLGEHLRSFPISAFSLMPRSSVTVRDAPLSHVHALLPRHPACQMGTLQQHPRDRQTQHLGYWTMSRKLVLVMVGLPARGKSYIVKMLIRYLNWIGADSTVRSFTGFVRYGATLWLKTAFTEAMKASGRNRDVILDTVLCQVADSCPLQRKCVACCFANFFNHDGATKRLSRTLLQGSRKWD